MKNKQTYVITMATGSYDDYSVGVVFITDDFAKGEAYVNKKNSAYQSMNKKVNSFYAQEYAQWQLEHPCPNPSVKGLIEVRKWKSGEKVTKEMRQEREEINLKNNKISELAYQPVTKWHKNLDKFSQDWALTHLTDDELEVYAERNENRWYIEEVNWL